MTGKEALDKLEEGFTLRRTSWNSDVKCKAYFLKDNKTIPEHVPDDPKFAGYMSIFDAIDAGEFLMDDWEIVE
jgi:hypothetical protein